MTARLPSRFSLLLAGAALALAPAAAFAQNESPQARTQPQMQAETQATGQDQTGTAQQQPGETTTTAVIPVWDLTAGEIADNPGLYYGSLVRVTAEVEDVVGPRAFTLDEDRIGAGPDVLVIVPQTAAGIADDDHVRVVGHLRPLVVAELDRDYGWFDYGWFDDLDLDMELEEVRPVLIAGSVIVDNEEMVAYDLEVP